MEGASATTRLAHVCALKGAGETIAKVCQTLDIKASRRQKAVVDK